MKIGQSLTKSSHIEVNECYHISSSYVLSGYEYFIINHIIAPSMGSALYYMYFVTCFDDEFDSFQVQSFQGMMIQRLIERGELQHAKFENSAEKAKYYLLEHMS